MFELIKTEKNKRFYKLDEPIKYIKYYPYIAKKFWEMYDNKCNQETTPDFIEYIVISDGIGVKERVAFIGYKCEKTNEIICICGNFENRFNTYYDIWILEGIIYYDKMRKEWNNLTKDELIDKYKNSNYKYDFGEYVCEKMQKEIIMEVILNNPKILKYASEKILEDKEFMLECIKINFDAMKYISYCHFGCNCDGE